MKNLSVQLLSSGSVDPELHYGINARSWWWQTSKTIDDSDSDVHSYHPICVGMKSQFIINDKKFILRVVKGNKTNEFLPGYCCQCEDYAGEVENNPTDAFSNLYQSIFKTSTRISGTKVLGFEIKEIVQELLLDIEFRPYLIQVEKNVKLFVYGLGTSNNYNGFCGAGNGYISCFNYTFESKWCTFIQKIIDDAFVVEIWFENSLLKKIKRNSPNDAWEEIGILTKLGGKKIAGLDNDTTNKILQDLNLLTCTPKEWEDKDLMNKIFEHHLKRRTIAKIDWYNLFHQWRNSDSNIIELTSSLEKIYPSGHHFTARELRAWNAMLKSVGCTDITPFSNTISPVS
jgi:hypothetical protein